MHCTTQTRIVPGFVISKLEQHAADLNTIASFLAAPDLLDLTSATVASNVDGLQADLLILLGNSVLHTVDTVAAAHEDGVAEELLLVGGRGHSTDLLRREVRDDPRYEHVPVEGAAEAEIMRDLLVHGCGLDEEDIMMETESTNCGENAENAYRLLRGRRDPPTEVLLVQDPTMQWRTWASFHRVWSTDSDVRFLNCPTFVPTVQIEAGTLTFEKPERPGLWSMERFITLVMGEIPRLRNDENGYGPRGRGYIVAVDIPPEVEAAYDRLQTSFGDYVRPLG